MPKEPASLQKLDAIATIDSTKSDSSWLAYIRSKIPKPQFHGRLSAEGFYTNFQNPRVLNEPQYLRLGGNASLSWFGLPLLVDFYRTTESQTFYNSNYFKMRFDYETFMNGITQSWQKTLNDATTSCNVGNFKKQQEDKAAEILEQQKKNLTVQQEKLKSALEQKALEYQKKYKQQADSMIQNHRDSLHATLQSHADSARHHAEWQKQKMRDSINLERLEQDTQRIAERIRDVKEKYAEVQEKKQFLDSMIAADSAKINQYKKLLEDPRGNAGTWLKEHGFPKQLVFLSYLKDFQTGIVNPMIHPYSIAGIGMKGFTTTLGPDKLEVQLSGGKAIISDMNYYNRNNAKYERLFVASSLKYQWKKNTEITLFGHHAQDPVRKFTRESRTAFRNSNYGIQISANPKNIVKLDGSVATSTYQSLNTVIKNTTYPGNTSISNAQSRWSKSAYILKAEKAVAKWLVLEASDQYVGPGFKNLGNPFMRTNFREQQARSKFTLAKSQLNITGFYKSMRDNPLGLSEITNRTSGYGLSLQTHFKNKKLPNLNGSVSPYEQGNNHPDSLFRVNSRYSIITTGLTYRIGKRRIKYFLMAYGSQSQMQFSDSLSAKVQTLSINQDLALGKHFTLGAGTTFVRTFPSVDSTQVNVYQLRLAYSGKKGFYAMLNSQYSEYLNGAFRKGAAFSVSIPVGKTYRLTAKAAFDHYHKLWGLPDQKAISGLVRLEIKL